MLPIVYHEDTIDHDVRNPQRELARTLHGRRRMDLERIEYDQVGGEAIAQNPSILEPESLRRQGSDFANRIGHRQQPFFTHEITEYLGKRAVGTWAGVIAQ